jgi:hypothetical protein
MANFYTEVISTDARFESVAPVSDSFLLEPTTRKLVESMVSAAQQMGIDVMIFETYRSQNRQQELFNNGATKLRTVGVHHYGLACDIVCVVSGEPCWKGDFSFLGQLAHSSGLIWGGDWGAPGIKHNFIDSVHVQRCTVRPARRSVRRKLVPRRVLQSIRRFPTSLHRRDPATSGRGSKGS